MAALGDLKRIGLHALHLSFGINNDGDGHEISRAMFLECRAGGSHSSSSSFLRTRFHLDAINSWNRESGRKESKLGVSRIAAAESPEASALLSQSRVRLVSPNWLYTRAALKRISELSGASLSPAWRN